MLRNIIHVNMFRKLAIGAMNVLSWFNKFIPKQDDSVLFYDGLNLTLTDNSEAFLLYLLNRKDMCNLSLQVYVMNGGSGCVCGLKNLSLISAIWTYMRSKYVFYSFGGMRIRPSNEQVVVNFWHGTPLKKIGKLIDYDKNLQAEEIDDFTYVVSPSKLMIPIFAKAFGCDENRVIVQGYPRCDYLLKHEYVADKVGIDKSKYKKIILWMPTFRISWDGRFKDVDNINVQTGLPLLDSIEKLKDFSRFLMQNNVLFVVKVHNYSVLPNVVCENIKIVTNDDLQNAGIVLYDFVKDFDALLTDYSSIYFDWLLLDRPVGFIIDDIDSYLKRRGFTLDKPLDAMPGHHIKTLGELKKYVIDVVDSNDQYCERRREINNKFNFYKSDFSKGFAEMIGLGQRSTEE